MDIIHDNAADLSALNGKTVAVVPDMAPRGALRHFACVIPV